MNKSNLLVPENHNTVTEIEKYASEDHKKAIIYKDNEYENASVSYKELISNANKVGNVFLNRGLKKGDKVLTMMSHAIVIYELYIAALKLGIAIVPSSEMLRTEDLQYRITHGGIGAVTSFDSLTKEFENVKEYDQLKKFIVAGYKEDWVSIEDEKEKVSGDLKDVDIT